MAKETDSKETIRRKLKSLRDSITEKERRLKSKLIEKNLFGLKELKNANTVMFFVSFGSEIETIDMIKKALGSKKKVVVPCVMKNPKRIIAVEITNPDTELEVGAYGILEPKNKTKEVHPGEIDLVLVPGLGFDSGGTRVGYGGGYYDLWLKNFSIEKRIGLGFDFQVISKIPTKENDLRLGKIVTDKRVIDCRTRIRTSAE